MGEPRKIWLVSDNGGVPYRLEWAAVETEGEWAPDGEHSHDWAAALTPAEEAAGWSAESTEWTSLPTMTYRDYLAASAANASVASRELTVGGCKWNLDDKGRKLGGADCCTPDATIVSNDDLIALVEEIGNDVVFYEKTTDKLVRAYAADPVTNPLVNGKYDSAVYRQTSDSQVVRVDG